MSSTFPEETVVKLGKEIRAAIYDLRRRGKLVDYSCGDRLVGFCAIASATLEEALARKGIKSRLAVGVWGDEVRDWDYANHAWLYVGDFSVDITARQWCHTYPEVFIEKHVDFPATPVKFGGVVDDWPWSQSPNEEVISLILENL